MATKTKLMRRSGTERRIVLGYDPGGRSGVAIIWFGGGEGPLCDWDTVDSADEALDWYAEKLAGAAVTGIGIDTPLCWETGRCGWRGPDDWLRETYPEARGSVVSTNSAHGAMVVQGPALARRLRALFAPRFLHLNESHPKVLYCALTRKEYPIPGDVRRDAPTTPMPLDAVNWLCRRIPVQRHRRGMTSDEWDAVLSAWATIQGLTGAWSRDLMAEAKCPLFPAGPATYYWPELNGRR